MQGLELGFAVVRARLLDASGAKSARAADMHTAATVVSAFQPLRVDPPRAVLGVGSAVELSWCGGPLPWSERFSFFARKFHMTLGPGEQLTDLNVTGSPPPAEPRPTSLRSAVVRGRLRGVAACGGERRGARAQAVAERDLVLVTRGVFTSADGIGGRGALASTHVRGDPVASGVCACEQALPAPRTSTLRTTMTRTCGRTRSSVWMCTSSRSTSPWATRTRACLCPCARGSSCLSCAYARATAAVRARR